MWPGRDQVQGHMIAVEIMIALDWTHRVVLVNRHGRLISGALA